MERTIIIKVIRTFSCASIIFISHATHSDETININEEYYGSDIYAAIIEANQNTRTGNYKNKYWYNRTTSKSFPLPKLSSQELERAKLNGAMQATSPGLPSNERFLLNKTVNHEMYELLKLDSNKEVATKSKIEDVKKQSIKNKQDTINIITESTHKFSRGDVTTTRNFISVGTITSTPQP